MFKDQIVAKDIEMKSSYIDIVSALEKTIESIDNHAIRKDIILAFDTNIDECYIETNYDFINNKVKSVLYEYIDKMQYGNKLSITLFASELKAKLNINEEELCLDL